MNKDFQINVEYVIIPKDSPEAKYYKKGQKHFSLSKADRGAMLKVKMVGDGTHPLSYPHNREGFLGQ